MEQSLPNFAKEAFHNLKNSFFQGASRRYYAQMDEESENEDDHNTHSLFYSVHQNSNTIEDSIPLTLSNAYSDRSQLLFEQSEEEEVTFHHSDGPPSNDYEESPVSFFFFSPVHLNTNTRIRNHPLSILLSQILRHIPTQAQKLYYQNHYYPPLLP